ncbi:MAG: DUF11 domain-containing protein, partial [Candidatus Bipolaricaulota bacterium]|nr:DUF11 domain-containing protein [Candidatus Bipolaricaulota bacterium]
MVHLLGRAKSGRLQSIGWAGALVLILMIEGIAQVAACDLEIRKEVAPSPLVAGQQAVFTITVRNVGTAPCPGPTTVTDSGAAGLSFVSASGSGWICIGQTCTYPGTIPVGGTVTVTYTYN